MQEIKTNFKWIEDAKIYQVFIDRFSGCKKTYTDEELRKGFLYGNLKSLISKLDYIQSQNFNVIWLSPFFVNSPSGYHGYHSTNLNHVDPRFAFGENPEDTEIGNPLDENDMNIVTKSDQVLIDLIKEIHNRKMKIMMDMVPNHVHSLHPFFKEAKTDKSSKYYKWFYFYEKEIEDSKKSKEKKEVETDYLKFLDVTILPKLNLDNKECGDYIINVTKHYLELGIDAIRADHIIGPSKEYVKRFSEEIHKSFPTVPVIGEILPVCIAPFAETVLGVDVKYLEKIKDTSLPALTVMDEVFLQYDNVLDGILDYTFTYLIDLYVQDKIKENELKQYITEHYAKFSKSNLILVKQLDSHDIDRILFRCKNDRNKLKKAMEYLYAKYDTRSDPLVMYYGTEDFMTQEKTMNGEPYGDFRVRQPMNFSLQWMKQFFKLKNE